MSAEVPDEPFETEEASFDFSYYNKVLDPGFLKIQTRYTIKMWLSEIGIGILVVSSVCLMFWALAAFLNYAISR